MLGEYGCTDFDFEANDWKMLYITSPTPYQYFELLARFPSAVNQNLASSEKNVFCHLSNEKNELSHLYQKKNVLSALAITITDRF